MKGPYVLASGNAGKLRELSAMLEPLGIEVKPQGYWGVTDAIEDASTFVENALIKARHAALATGLPTIADDSGLVVPALGGRPGIYSARFAGENADSAANIQKLLAAMHGFSGAERNAYFYCSLVLVKSETDPAPMIASGRWHGSILTSQRGAGGFGYDPVFGVRGVSGIDDMTSAAELLPDQKAAVSHRGRALRELLRQLRQDDDTTDG